MSLEDRRYDLVVVGAGQAAGDLATTLRLHGYAGSIAMIGDEAYLPYRRPPLSKAFLAGEATRESLLIKRQEIYVQQGVDCLLGVGVASLHRHARQVQLHDGARIGYRHLVLATGGRPRRLALPGAQQANVHYVRTIDDILRLQCDVRPQARLVIIGGGYIGLEVAAVGVKLGLQVTVVEAQERLLSRVAAPEVSAFYARVHHDHGVEIITGAGVRQLAGGPRVDTVVLDDGTRLPADVVVVGIGLEPNVELAEAAGLTVGNGIVVDTACRTSDADIWAIGDCTWHENAFYGRHHRLESVPNATEQARVAALNLCGKPTIHEAVPWFWSDQYDLKLQMVGLSSGYDRLVMRGDMAASSFVAFYLKEGVLLSADAVNRPVDFMAARKLVAVRAVIDADDLADDTRPLKSLLAPQPA